MIPSEFKRGSVSGGQVTRCQGFVLALIFALNLWKYNFRWSRARYYFMLECLSVAADNFQRSLFGRICLFCLFDRKKCGNRMVLTGEVLSKQHGQPCFPVSNCCFLLILRHLCLILENFAADVYFRKTVVRKCLFLLFSYLECADNSRSDLVL